jgi:hypothetical protein
MAANQRLDWMEIPAKRHGKALALKAREVSDHLTISDGRTDTTGAIKQTRRRSLVLKKQAIKAFVLLISMP